MPPATLSGGAAAPSPASTIPRRNGSLSADNVFHAIR